MAISFVQFKVANTASSGSSLSATFTNPITAGSFIAVGAITDTGVSSFTFADGKGDTPTDSGLGSFVDSTIGIRAQVVAFLAPSSGAQTITITPNVNFSFGEIVIWEIAGITGPVFDKAIYGTTPSGTAATSGATGTLSAAAEAAIGYGFAATQGYNGLGTGSWTLDTFTPNGFNDITEHQVLSSNASIAATGTLAGSSYNGVICATFMAGGGGGGTTLTAAQGSFTETGQAALFVEKMPAAQGSFTETGQAAGLVQGTRLTSAQGSFALTGQAALFPEVMPAAFGSFTLTGLAATLSATSGSTLTAAFGSFTETGQAAGLVLNTILTSASGSFTETGQAALFPEVMPAAFGSFTLSGQSATLSASNSSSLVAAFGSFALTGGAVVFAEKMPAAQGSFTETGQASLFAEVMPASFGTFALTGEAATLSVTVNALAAGTGLFSLTGHAASLILSGVAAPLPTMRSYKPKVYPKIDGGVPIWHTDQNNQISASIQQLIEVAKALDDRLRTGGL